MWEKIGVPPIEKKMIENPLGGLDTYKEGHKRC